MPDPKEAFQQIWLQSPVAARLVNNSGIILACNEAYAQLVEIPRTRLIGQKLTIVYHTRARKQLLNTFIRFAHDNKLPKSELLKLRMWNGRRAWLDLLHTPFPSSGTDQPILSIIRDVTRTWENEKRHREIASRFRSLFDQTNDAIFVNHINNHSRLGTFIEVNDIATRKLLYSKEEFSHLNPYSIIPYPYYARMDQALSNLIKKGHDIFQIDLLRKDKQRIPVEISARIFSFNGQETLVSVARDMTQRMQVEKQLQNTSQRLRDLASRIQTVREEERAMLAREIHDELGQVLTVLKIQLSLTSNKLYPEQEELKAKLEATYGLLDRAVEAVQQISAKLRPGILDELGVVAAIDWQAQDFEKITGIACKCSLLKTELNLSVDRATAIFRIFQEALTNVARHANAQRVSVFLRIDEGQLILEITDNGIGINKSQIHDRKSLGLLGMRERALVFGGDVQINGVPGQGTHVKVVLPLEEIHE